ncbi:hypothetical protein H3Z85_00975 [Chryseobacterium indologenes]|uniref:Uncharacterized protein n=3 Tax=Chryseobacterium TaxID=59732 RepID=A0A3G6RJI9_CHRLC|nr:MULTISPECIES: hypothetical protein [Bacteroidota]AZA84607.1 hypothetical protein EG342_23115 [Chryseobacterium lactis]AZB04995.1 hypothetical protein EG341_13995 [Chryseobacterium lactis]KMQ64466.1 hypothetical protein ACM46_09335 [Chryseobacterium angstadtii]MBF6643588.1 hypothetical protein [Chryseobacterium indologenes]PNW14726.1 hypothetical protein C1637_07145 [Chryseobacterium lactis]
MEDTINSKFDANSGQIFRITYKNRDFQIRLLKRGITKDIIEVDLLLDGVIQKLLKRDKTWYFENSDADQELAKDIWRAISLRYRL